MNFVVVFCWWWMGGGGGYVLFFFFFLVFWGPPKIILLRAPQSVRPGLTGGNENKGVQFFCDSPLQQK